MEAIMEKVQKILARAKNNPNQHEAELAMKMAQELMIKHNLRMQDVENKSSDYTLTEGVDHQGKILPEIPYILQILDEYFFVKPFFTRKRSFDGSRGVSVSFVGKPENVEVAMYVYNFLKETYRAQYRAFLDQYYGRNIRTQKFIHSFYQGLTNGLWTKLKMDRMRVSAELGLVLVKDPGIQKYMDNMFNLKTQKMSQSGEANHLAKMVGQEKGKNIRINPGLGAREDQIRMLT